MGYLAENYTDFSWTPFFLLFSFYVTRPLHGVSFIVVTNDGSYCLYDSGATDLSMLWRMLVPQKGETSRLEAVLIGLVMLQQDLRSGQTFTRSEAFEDMKAPDAPEATLSLMTWVANFFEW